MRHCLPKDLQVCGINSVCCLGNINTFFCFLYFVGTQSVEPWQSLGTTTFAFITPEYMKSTRKAFSGKLF